MLPSVSTPASVLCALVFWLMIYVFLEKHTLFLCSCETVACRSVTTHFKSWSALFGLFSIRNEEISRKPSKWITKGRTTCALWSWGAICCMTRFRLNSCFVHLSSVCCTFWIGFSHLQNFFTAPARSLGCGALQMHEKACEHGCQKCQKVPKCFKARLGTLYTV